MVYISSVNSFDNFALATVQITSLNLHFTPQKPQHQMLRRKKAEPKTPHILTLNQNIVASPQDEKCGLKYVIHILAFCDFSPYVSPALRKAFRNFSLSSFLLYVSLFSKPLTENLGCILSTSAASVRAASSLPDKL